MMNRSLRLKKELRFGGASNARTSPSTKTISTGLPIMKILFNRGSATICTGMSSPAADACTPGKGAAAPGTLGLAFPLTLPTLVTPAVVSLCCWVFMISLSVVASSSESAYLSETHVVATLPVGTSIYFCWLMSLRTKAALPVIKTAEALGTGAIFAPGPSPWIL